jgi:hypothetical protein
VDANEDFVWPGLWFGTVNALQAVDVGAAFANDPGFHARVSGNPWDHDNRTKVPIERERV